MAAFNEISPVHLMRLIGTSECPQLIDVRIDDDFDADPYFVPTAKRVSHTDISSWMPTPDRPVVVICQRGLKLSHGVAALLRQREVSAQVLSGGSNAWADAQLPRVPASITPTSLWVTRHRPKIDRIACPWLIRRFVDTDAEFLFVPPSEVLAVAEHFNATAFDVDGCDWGHDGDQCTFDAMVERFGLRHAPLNTLATVVRAADTNRHELAPQAAGLLALSIGLSRLHKDDIEQMNAGLVLYDALYRWARDGQTETHDWPAGHK